MSQLIDSSATTPRARMFWAVTAVLLLAQVVAIYMLCSQQVRKAGMRATAIQAQRTAINHCLHYTPHATIASCTTQRAALNTDGSRPQGEGVMTASHRAGPIGNAGAAITSVVPVGFSYR